MPDGVVIIMKKNKIRILNFLFETNIYTVFIFFSLFASLSIRKEIPFQFEFAARATIAIAMCRRNWSCDWRKQKNKNEQKHMNFLFLLFHFQQLEIFQELFFTLYSHVLYALALTMFKINFIIERHELL